MVLEAIGTVGQPEIAGRVILGQWHLNERLRLAGMAILKHHSYRCNSCGFTSRPSRQVPHAWMTPVDLNHPGMAAQNKGTCLCPLCASAAAVNWSVISKHKGGQDLLPPGLLIYCPWIPQSKLNLIAAYSIAIRSSSQLGKSTAMEAVVRSVDAAIIALKEDVGANIPTYRGKDSDFARTLALLPDVHYERRSDLIGTLRWWPNLDFWGEQGRYWQQASLDPVHDRLKSTLEGLL